MGNQLEPTKKQLVLKTTQKNLITLIESKKDAMPKGFNKTRFIQNCMTVLSDTYKIEECQPLSIARTLLKGAFLGLDFFMKECYAIPYKGELSFQTDYKGEVKLVRLYSVKPIADIYAKLVREGDIFEEGIEDNKQVINFKPLPFNNGNILGAFAVVCYQDGSMQYEAMSTADIEHIKVTFSQKSYKTGKYSKAWEETPGEMYKKTVLRRLTKHISKEFDTIEQSKEFDKASGMDFEEPEKITTEVPNTFVKPDQEVTDIETEPVIETPDKPEQQEMFSEVYNGDLDGTPFGGE